MLNLEQNAEIGPGRFLGRFPARFYAKLELFRASRRFSLLQTLRARRYEKRTQQAELVGKMRQATMNFQCFCRERGSGSMLRGHYNRWSRWVDLSMLVGRLKICYWRLKARRFRLSDPHRLRQRSFLFKWETHYGSDPP